MPLLPRSRRGTGLLAGAVWLAACVGLWWVLPVVSREVLRLQESEVLLGFGPGGATAVIGTHAMSESPLEFNFKLVSVPNAEILKGLPANSESLGHSIDGCVWLFRHGTSCFKLDAANRTVTRLGITAADSRYFPIGAVTGDGRFCLFEDRRNSRETVVWDLDRDLEYGVIAPGAWTDGFDADGRTVFLAWGDPLNKLTVIDSESLEVRASMIVPGAYDGSYMINGLPPQTPRFAAGAVITNYSGDLRVYDFPSGRLRFCRGTRLWGYVGVSTDGRILSVHSSRDETVFEKFIGRLRSPSVFAMGDPVLELLFDTETGQELSSFPTTEIAAGANDVRLAGRNTVAVHDSRNPTDWLLYDIPPRKSLPWFGVGAALLALPIALVARGRVRRLKAA
jgi:hypothetical protein